MNRFDSALITLLALVPSLVVLSACGSNESSGSAAPSRETPTASTAADPSEAPSEPVPDEPAPAEATPAAPTAPTWPLAIDTHVDTPQRMLDADDDISQELPNGHLDVPRMREGGLSAAFFSIWVDPRRYPGEEAWARSQALVQAVLSLVRQHPDQVALCRTATEVRAAHASGRIGVLMGIEGAHGLGEADPVVLLTRLREMYDLGVRYMTVTWTNDNVFAHASTGAHPRRGLTDAGRRLVRDMNEMGMIIDVSHVSDRTVSDVLDITTRPVFASHSSARALGEHVRNMPDDLIRRVGEGGGAVCVNYYAQYIDPTYGAARRALEDEHRAEFDALAHGHRSWETLVERNALARRLAPELHPPTLETLGAHFAHIAEVAGIGGVCLGSDFDGVGELPAGMEDVSDLPALYAELTRRQLELAPILGGNVLRVLAAQAHGE